MEKLKSLNQPLQNNNGLKLTVLSIFLSLVLITSGSSIQEIHEERNRDENLVNIQSEKCKDQLSIQTLTILTFWYL
jgi:hypothetical protein